MVKKRGGNKKSSKKKINKKLPGVLWFVLGVVITLWTLLWLLITMNSKDISTAKPVVLFGIGFYAMIIFIIGTLIFYIFRFFHRIKKKIKNKNKFPKNKKTQKRKNLEKIKAKKRKNKI